MEDDAHARRAPSKGTIAFLVILGIWALVLVGFLVAAVVVTLSRK